MKTIKYCCHKKSDKKTIYKKMNYKNAIFYMLTVIVFLGIMVIIMYTYKSYSMMNRQESLEIRIRSMNDFINDFNNDVHRSTRISATRALIALEDHVSISGQYFNSLDEFRSAFKETFYYGSINGTNHSLMKDSSFKDYENKVSANAKNIGMNFFINVSNIQLEQDDPWNVLIIIDAQVKLNDSSKLAYWDFNESFVTEVPIIGLRDPLYSINTFGRVQNTIRQANTTIFVEGTNTSMLLSHVNNGYYIESVSAPSFLMRFYNNISSSPQGIESLVNIRELNDQGLTIYISRPVVDYKYFSGAYTADVCNIQNMPDWFKLEVSDLNNYDLGGLNYTTC